MAAAVLDGQWAAAFHWNGAAFVLIVAVGLRTVGWLVELASGSRLRLADRGPLRRISQRHWILIAAALCALWVLARNLPRYF